MPESGLPPTIAGLRRALTRGTTSIGDAVAAQVRTIADRAAAFRCVVTQHAVTPGAGASGPLAGVGLAHKDVFELAGRAPKCGARTAPQRRATRSARAIERLEHAGARNLAALAMTEFACGATGENRHGPEPVNPLDADAVVGGSSSGSAAAVAAGLCYASLGTDTAGSIRIPAATVGVVGLKPTMGLVSTAGVFPLAPSIDCVGIIARSAADCAEVLRVVAEYDDRPPPAPASTGRARRWRIAVALPADGLDTEVAQVLAAFIDRLRATAAVRDVRIDNVEALTHRAEAIMHVEAARLHRRRILRRPDSVAPALRAIALPGLAIPASWYRRALEDRAALAQAFCRPALDVSDLLLVPALPHTIPDWSAVHTASPRFDARELLALHRWMPFVNYLGLPALVFPVGADTRGRPVSIQAIGRPYAEHTLLAFAHQAMRRDRD